MLTRAQYFTLTGLGAAAVLLFVTNATLFTLNKSAQSELNARQAEVQQSIQLQGLQTEIAKALADLAIKSDDKQVFDMLAANGITVTKNAPSSSGAKSASAKH
jgi:type VI protein secretion system component VasK